MNARIVIIACFLLLSGIPARAQWVQCSGPEGGSILKLAEMGSYTFAGTSGGTLYRSSNAGASWSQVLGTTNSYFIGITISDSTVFFASDSLYFSSDSGSTWIARGLPYYRAGPLAKLGRWLFITTRDEGVFRTSDKGNTWELVSSDLGSAGIFVKDSTLYVGYQFGGGLTRSTDSGNTWTTVMDADSILKYVNIQTLAFAGSNIFAGASQSVRFYRSTDNGITWDSSAVGLPKTESSNNAPAVMCLYFDSTLLFAGTIAGLFRSTDSGATWTQVSDMNIQTMLQSGGFLLAGTATEGIVRSTDHGLHWTSSNTGLCAQQITSFASIGSRLFVGVSGKGIYRSDDSGMSFIPTNNGIDSQNVGQIIAADTMLFAFTSGILFVSSNLGDSWHSTHDSVFTPAVTIGSSLIATNYNGSFVLSSDGGASWITRGNAAGYIVSLVSNGSDLFACFGKSDCDHFVASSRDSGLTWKLAAGTDCTYLYSVASDGDYLFAGAGPAYASGGGGLLQWKKTDSSWTYTYSPSFPDVPIDEYAVNSITSSKSDIYFSAAEAINRFGGEGIGVFHSSDYGNNWSTFNEGLTALIVPQLFIFPPYIFAGTQSSSVWRRSLSGSGISSVAQAPLPQTHLHIYPNPFSQSTQITFTSQAAGYAEVSIVNMLGVEVARLFVGELGAGEHNFTWDAGGTSAPRGVYECLLRMNGQVETLPVVLMR